MKDRQSGSSKKSARRKNKLLVLGVTLWVSFLSAGFATMLFFSAFDPSVIAQLATFPMKIARSTGYSVGFFLFWLLLVANSVLVVCLLERDPK